MTYSVVYVTVFIKIVLFTKIVFCSLYIYEYKKKENLNIALDNVSTRNVRFGSEHVHYIYIIKHVSIQKCIYHNI